MRIIGGSAKGARLHQVPGGTRPLSDRAREGLFSSLAPDLPGARCADLYAGTGAIGIEALSRGAAECLFVDAARGAIRAIQANLQKTGLSDRARVAHQDAARQLRREPPDSFDLVFLDPPYAVPGRELAEVLSEVRRAVAPGGAVALTRPKRDATGVVPIDWPVARRLAYGDARILIFREAS